MPAKRKATQAPGATTPRRSKRLHDRAARTEQQSKGAQLTEATNTNVNAPLPDAVGERADRTSINSDGEGETATTSTLHTTSSLIVNLTETERCAIRLDHAVQRLSSTARLSALPGVDTQPGVGPFDAATAPPVLAPLIGTSRIRPVLKFTGRAGSQPLYPAVKSGNEQLSAQILRNLNYAKLNGLNSTITTSNKPLSPAAPAPAPASIPVTADLLDCSMSVPSQPLATVMWRPVEYAPVSPWHRPTAVPAPATPLYDVLRFAAQERLPSLPDHSPTSPSYHATRSAVQESLPAAPNPAVTTTGQNQTDNDARGADNSHLSEEDWHKYIVLVHKLASSPRDAVNAESAALPAPHDQSTLIIDDDETLSISDIEDQY